MPHPRLTDEEIRQRGQELYEKKIRARVETKENIGKLVSVDVETGDYEIGDDVEPNQPTLVEITILVGHSHRSEDRNVQRLKCDHAQNRGDQDPNAPTEQRAKRPGSRDDGSIHVELGV